MDKKVQDKLLKQIAVLKFGYKLKDFVCKQCGNRKCNTKNYPSSVRCTVCNKIEGTLVGTAFENSKIPLSIKFNIINDFYESFPIRPKQKVLSNRYGISEKSIEGFIKKISTHYDIAEFDTIFFEDNKSDLIFFEGLSEKSKNVYHSLYWLIKEQLNNNRINELIYGEENNNIKIIIQQLTIKDFEWD